MNYNNLAGRRLFISYRDGGPLYGWFYFVDIQFGYRNEYILQGYGERTTILGNTERRNWSDAGTWRNNGPRLFLDSDFGPDGSYDLRSVKVQELDPIPGIFPPPVTNNPLLLSVNDIEIQEGDRGNQNAFFTVTLSNPSDERITVKYRLVGDTASAADYLRGSGIITFSPNTTEKRVQVRIKGDKIAEGEETLQLQLSNPSKNVKIEDGIGIATIKDNEPTPSLTVGDITVREGDRGSKNAFFTVNLSNPSDERITVKYSLVNGEAKHPDDYLRSSGTLSFAPNSTEQKIRVRIKGDNLAEGQETFQLRLSSPSKNVQLKDRVATVTIVDNEPIPSLTVDDITIREGDRGSKNAFFTVNLSNPSDERITVKYSLVNGEAKHPDDYLRSSGTLSFAPNSTEQTVKVRIKGDTLAESRETFQLRLSNPSKNVKLRDRNASATILDNDRFLVTRNSKDELTGTSEENRHILGKKAAEFAVLETQTHVLPDNTPDTNYLNLYNTVGKASENLKMISDNSHPENLIIPVQKNIFPEPIVVA